MLHDSGFGKENFESEPKFELYDMETDPLEMNNIADDTANARVLRKLKNKLKRLQKKVGDKLDLDSPLKQDA